MLALPLAMLLALPAGELQAAGPATAQDSSLVASNSFVPSGTATGTWVAGTVTESGVLVALMVDEAGEPVFVLDAQLTPQGAIYGDLRTLEYATNPALGMPPLKAVGQAQISQGHGGTFWAVISGPIDGPMPVSLFGRIEGALLPVSSRGIKPTGASALSSGSFSDVREVAGAALARKIVCTSGSSLAVSGLGSLGVPVQEAGASSTLIICPHGSELGSDAHLASGSLGGAVGGVATGGMSVRAGALRAGAQEIEGQSTVITCPYLPYGVQAHLAPASAALGSGSGAGSSSGAFHAGQVGGEVQLQERGGMLTGQGMVRAYWYLISL